MRQRKEGSVGRWAPGERLYYRGGRKKSDKQAIGHLHPGVRGAR